MEFSNIKVKGLTDLVKQALLEYIETQDTTEEYIKLPREEILATQMGVSRITIRTALNELASAGIIFRKHGKGTFVNSIALNMKVVFNPINDVRDVIKNSGYEVTDECIKTEIRQSTSEEARKLSIPEGSEIACIERLFYANDIPAICCIDRFPKELLRIEDQEVTIEQLEEIASVSSFAYLKEKLGIEVSWDKVELSVIATKKKAVLEQYFSNVKEKALLDCDIINFDTDDRPVMYSNEYGNTDFIRYELIRKKKFD